jgi:hypothetical protein
VVPDDDAPDPVPARATAAQPRQPFGLMAARPSAVTVREVKVAVVGFSLGALVASVIAWFAAPRRAS